MRNRIRIDRWGRRISLIAVFALAVLTQAAAPAAAAHPFHVSLAEMEWNRETGRLEVALRVWPQDLEQALEGLSGSPIDLDDADAVEPLIRDYVADSFRVRVQGRGDKQAWADQHWLGQEIGIKEAWLYFEIECPQGPQHAELENRLFLEFLDDQVNLVQYRRPLRQTVLSFRQGETVQTLPR